MTCRRFASLTLLVAFALLPLACQGQSQQTTGAAPPAASQAPEAQAGAPPSRATAGELPMVPAHARSEGGGDMTWKVPEGWKEVPPSSSLRRAQYSIPPVQGDADAGECAVFYFGAGQGGDVNSNVQRWASQFKGPGGATPAPKITEVRSGGQTLTRVEVKGTYEASSMGSPHGGGAAKPGYMLLGAIVPGGDANWFFKCTGPEKTMEKNRRPFDGMIASVKPGV